VRVNLATCGRVVNVGEKVIQSMARRASSSQEGNQLLTATTKEHEVKDEGHEGKAKKIFAAGQDFHE
jgi:hypothetical protein